MIDNLKNIIYRRSVDTGLKDEDGVNVHTLVAVTAETNGFAVWQGEYFALHLFAFLPSIHGITAREDAIEQAVKLYRKEAAKAAKTIQSGENHGA